MYADDVLAKLSAYHVTATLSTDIEGKWWATLKLCDHNRDITTSGRGTTPGDALQSAYRRLSFQLPQE